MFDMQLWQQIITQFHFLRPWWLLAALPLAVLIYLRWRQESHQQWQQALPAHLRAVLTIGDVGWQRQLPLKLLALAMCIAIVICAGPSWQRQASPFGEDKAALLIVLDNSESMLQKDVAPNRLARAKHKIRDLLALRGGGQSGLVVFAGSAHLAMPLTKDNAVLTPYLAAIEPDIMPVPGKGAATVLALIEPQLGSERGGTVLLITDATSAEVSASYGDYFAGSRHQLLVLAAGNPDKVSAMALDWPSLQRLAKQSKGSAVVMTVDDTDIASLNRRIERHMQLNSDSMMPWQDMGYCLLFPVAFLMLLWFRKGWLVKWTIMLLVALPMSYMQPLLAAPVSLTASSTAPNEDVSSWQKISQWWLNLWLTPDQQGQWYFQQGAYLQAAKHYRDPLSKGIAYYYGGEYKLAHSVFLQLQSDIGMFNAANALARQRQYVQARDGYQQLLARELATDMGDNARHNLAMMQALIDEVNRISESQKGSTDGPEQSFELADEQPQTGDGAKEPVASAMLKKDKLNASDIIGSPALAEKWLSRVEADPKYFLRAKFQLQHQQNKKRQQGTTPLAPKGKGE